MLEFPNEWKERMTKEDKKERKFRKGNKINIIRKRRTDEMKTSTIVCRRLKLNINPQWWPQKP